MQSSANQKKQTNSCLSSTRQRRPYFDGDDDGTEREKSVERPTLPTTEALGIPVQPSKPKIVVLGASGKIGSLVVKQLMEMSELDVTVVAFVRDYDKACRVLYDDVLVARKTKGKGPQLQIVVGDLVPPEELPGFQDEDEEIWEQTAQSAAKFYEKEMNDYDNREMLPDVNEALQDAVRGCTTIISCVGSVRPTNVWSDLMALPFWRLFRHDVSGWCRDARHPFYVHFASTRKVLGYAEREQLRREAIAAALAEEDDSKPKTNSRIRFVRVSDLCVTQKPWEFVPLLTNALQSMVFRYQDMTERLIEESTLLDTVILRPGDLVDEDRDDSTTSLQVDPSGKVPSPARVGRDDVAALAVASALFQSVNATNISSADDSSEIPPLHLKLGVRWAGQDLQPYPSQGHRRLGLADAGLCMNKVLKDYPRETKRRRDLKTKGNAPASILRYVKSRKRRRLKPYGVYVAVPVYLILGLVFKNVFVRVPGAARVTPVVAGARDTLVAAFLPFMRKSIQRLTRRNTKSFISF